MLRYPNNAPTRSRNFHAAGLDARATTRAWPISATLRSDDQIPTCFEISVSTADTVEGRMFASTEYNKRDTGNNLSARNTVDWFPFTDGNRFFVRAGLDFNESRFTAGANSSKGYSIGNQAVKPSDNISTNLDIDYNNSMSPFLGIGCGNRIGRNSGFSFLAEIGVLILSGDVDVKLKVTDPDNLVSDADIYMEKSRSKSRSIVLAAWCRSGFCIISDGSQSDFQFQLADRQLD